jgi:hypothetical protein
MDRRVIDEPLRELLVSGAVGAVTDVALRALIVRAVLSRADTGVFHPLIEAYRAVVNREQPSAEFLTADQALETAQDAFASGVRRTKSVRGAQFGWPGGLPRRNLSHILVWEIFYVLGVEAAQDTPTKSSGGAG